MSKPLKITPTPESKYPLQLVNKGNDSFTLYLVDDQDFILGELTIPKKSKTYITFKMNEEKDSSV